ncbi:kinase-like domain-containing protein [Mycena metata]|uniref:Kinase-like domain-containing protein n=1 Tax=Mycena metata TaxID=1033252 RepID=A0AAD7H093_9AGAR|nr:kinase-like domain-containing protein [Mycena metata]
MSIQTAIDVVLGITPVPGLAAAFKVFQFIVSTVQKVQASKEQLSELAKSLGELLATLDGQFQESKLVEASCAKPLNDLMKLLQDIAAFIKMEQSRNFLKALLHADSRVAAIDIFYHRLDLTAAAFEISAFLSISTMLRENEGARSRDVAALNSRFAALERNQSNLKKTLEINDDNAQAMMVSIRRGINRLEDTQDSQGGGFREQQFYSHTLQYLTSTSGQSVELEDWIISPFDVDRGEEIGAGGFGTVCKGTWNRTQVAIKWIHNSSGVGANNKMLESEVKIWMTLRHPNVLQFLGANTLDDSPFVVMPLMRSTSREFLQIKPDFDILSILRDVSLGIEYLHSRKICHGDLKGKNILVDERGLAVISDFGLTRIKADITSRTHTPAASTTSDSRNWMAPELLKGSLPRIQSDIYALGMTIYELYTDTVPMAATPEADFFRVVVILRKRPEKPGVIECPRMTAGVWRLAEQCWHDGYKQRPNARQIHDSIEILMVR